MEASIRRLRELLNFDLVGQNHLKSQNPQDILSALSGLPAPIALQNLCDQYFPVVNAETNRETRFQLLEDAQPEIENCLPMLEKLICEAILPLPAKIGVAALAADNCLKSLSSSYSSIVSNICNRKLDANLAELLQKSAYRAMQALLRRQTLAYRAYAKPSTASWQYMHDLYHIAREHGVAALDDEASIERLYISALLLAYADPNTLPRHNLDALQEALNYLTPFASIIGTSDIDLNHDSLTGRFLVSTDNGGPGRPLAKAGILSKARSNLIVDCRGVINALDRNMVQELDVDQNIPENVLQILRTAMNGQWSRRFTRQRFKPKAHLVAGMGNALELISASGNAQKIADAMTGASDWALLNESPDGFGVRYLTGPRWQAQTGDIVILRMPDENRLHICLVRRISNRKPDKFDLGLQELSPYASVIQLPAQEGQGSKQAIFLPHLPAFDGKAGMLARIGSFPANAILRTFGDDGQIHLWRRGIHSENNGLVEFLVLAQAETLS